MKLAEIHKGIAAKKDDQPPPPFIKTSRADTIFGATILLNSAFIGVDLELGGEGFNPLFWFIECLFIVVFATEIVLRFRAELPDWRAFFDGWGCFDTVCTGIGAVDAWIITPALGSGSDNPLSSFTVLRVFRLVRLVRLVRVLRMFSELVVLVQTLGNSIRAVGWMSLLLLMITYTGSIVTVLLLGVPYKDTDDDINQYFGSLGDALFSHFCVVTLEGWPDIATAAINKHWMWAIYFVGMIALTNFALVNLMVGVIVERIIHLSLEQESEMSAFVAESKQFESTLHLLWQQADKKGDADGVSSRKELRDLLGLPDTHDIFNAFGINLNVPPATLHTIMDLDPELDADRGPVSFKEFFDACLRLCGSKQSVHSIFVQHDICDCHRKITTSLQSLERTIQGGSAPGRPGMSWDRGAYGSHTGMPPPGSGGKALAPMAPEEAVAQLFERMDKFGQVQQSIHGELQTIRDYAKTHGFKGDAPAVSLDTSGPALLEKSGRDLGGACCIDTMFTRRKGTTPRQAPPSPRSASAGPPIRGDAGQNLRSLHRKGLEAEFRSKQAASGR